MREEWTKTLIAGELQVCEKERSELIVLSVAKTDVLGTTWAPGATLRTVSPTEDATYHGLKFPRSFFGNRHREFLASLSVFGVNLQNFGI